MKVKAAAVEGFVARPDPRAATVLLHGPDAGLVAERARRLAAGVVDDLQDPFRVSELSGDAVAESPGRLTEEAQALCLLGGRRVVRVRGAGDQAAAAVRDLLALPEQAGFVVIEAGDLPAGSSLRRLVEGAANAAALPCYRDEARDLAAVVRASLAERGLAATSDAAAYLEAHLGGDRAVTRAELAKLALYMADRPGAPVALEDAAAVVGDGSALGVDDAVNAALLGRRRELDRALERLLAEGEAPVRLIRAAAAAAARLLRLGAAGGNAEAAVAAARPPIFFRHRTVFVAALRRWSPDRLARALALLQAAELRCKGGAGGGAPDQLLCRAVLAQVAGLPDHGDLPADGRAKRR